MEKKFLIPIILGVLLLCGIVFTVVYKNTSGSSPNNDPIVQTLAPKETEPVETKVVSGDKESLEDFNINKVKPNETKVAYIDEEGNLLSDEEAKALEESEMESVAQMVEQASIDAQSIKEEDYVTDESEEESFSPEELSDFQSGVSMKIRELTAQDAIADMKTALKFDVEKYAPEYPELQGITSEMIDNYSEEEVYELYNKISEIIGY